MLAELLNSHRILVQALTLLVTLLKSTDPEFHTSRDSKGFRTSYSPVSTFCSYVCSGVSKEVGAGLSFTSSATKGSLLILPEGASQIDHQEYTKFYRFAAECARSWYTYVNGPLARGAHNGSLYLVTGCDKARAWGVASFVDARPGSVSLDFVPEEPDDEGGPPEYSFSKCNSASSSSDADNIFQNQSGCVFLRGFKIAVKIPPFMTSSNVAAKVTYIGQLGPDDLLPQSRSTDFAIPIAMQWWLKPYLASEYDYQNPSTTHNAGVFNIPVKYQACLYILF